jgi:hypothetical protein
MIEQTTLEILLTIFLFAIIAFGLGLYAFIEVFNIKKRIKKIEDKEKLT